MTVTISGSTGITGPNTDNDVVLNGVTVGLGGGSVSTNTAVGVSALQATTSGNFNTATGYQAGYTNTTGVGNSYFGRGAGYANSTSNYNSAFGNAALYNNTGASNSALGSNALNSNISGNYNTAVGDSALTSNTTASNNTAIGYQAGYNNTIGQFNVLLGFQAGYRSAGVGSIGDASVYIGYQAGYANQGNNNIGIGNGALSANTTGTFNVGVGVGSGSAITTGGKNTIIGAYTGSGSPISATGSNYIVLSDGDGNVRIYHSSSAFYVQSVYDNTTAASANVTVASNGGISRVSSALKYKTNVRDLPAIDITKFRPVVYNSLCEGDDKAVDHFGFIADEVDQAGYKQLVSYGAQGEVEGFQYERMTAVLTQQVQQLLATVNAQATEIAALKAKVGI